MKPKCSRTASEADPLLALATAHEAQIAGLEALVYLARNVADEMFAVSDPEWANAEEAHGRLKALLPLLQAALTPLAKVIADSRLTTGGTNAPA